MTTDEEEKTTKGFRKLIKKAGLLDTKFSDDERVEAGDGIKAGWGIEAGDGIKAGWVIEAGDAIITLFGNIVANFVSCLRICVGFDSKEESYVESEIRKGDLIYGKLKKKETK